MPSNIFISYTREDERIAVQVRRKLKQARKQGWLDIEDIHGGENWIERIDVELRNAQAVVVLMSPKARKSEYVTYEWSFALGVGVRVIPVLIKKTTLHPRLRGLQCINLMGTKKRWALLIKQLEIRRDVPEAAITAGVNIPLIHARFCKDNNGKLIRSRNGSYDIVLSMKQVPDGTEKVTYEILDDTFEEPKFTVIWGKGDFEETIDSWGDIFITAKGKGKSGPWRTKTKLSEALGRQHRNDRSAQIRKALKEIADN